MINLFLQDKKDVLNFYHETDLLFLPSKGEGFASVIMESMDYGVPVVSSNIGGTRCLIKNKYNGFLCKYEDIDCYLDKITNNLVDWYDLNSKALLYYIHDKFKVPKKRSDIF